VAILSFFAISTGAIEAELADIPSAAIPKV